MPGWQGSDRRRRLPPNWEEIRQAVLKRDGYRCRVLNVYGERCPRPADEVDHIKNGDDHRMENLQSICDFHHGRKSGGEGARAVNEKRRRINQKFRRVERHPGLL